MLLAMILHFHLFTGRYLLSLQHALDQEHHYGSPEPLLDILQDSGKKIIYAIGFSVLREWLMGKLF